MNTSAPELEIRREILLNGSISFAKFMEIALYWPDGGYYVNATRKPYLQDFYTSPVTHPAFGALITLQLFNFWKILRCPKKFTILELGSGRGELAKAILKTSNQLPMGFYNSINYIQFDRSSGHIFDELESYPKNITGCVLSNELLDAFPVHRFEITSDGPKEIYIGTDREGNLIESLGNISDDTILNYINSPGRKSDVASKGEVSLEIDSWAKMISDLLFKGFVITIDYGYEQQEKLQESSLLGTIQTHRNHCSGTDTLSMIGATDITTDVNFSHVLNATEKLGLNTIKFISQKKFLQSLGFGELIERLRSSNISRVALMQNQMSMLELIKPEGFGQFKVLIQEKNTGIGRDDIQLAKNYISPSMIALPLMDKSNIDLLGSKYPHNNWEPPTYEDF